jgi:hypothetical protein
MKSRRRIHDPPKPIYSLSRSALHWNRNNEPRQDFCGLEAEIAAMQQISRDPRFSGRAVRLRLLGGTEAEALQARVAGRIAMEHRRMPAAHCDARELSAPV